MISGNHESDLNHSGSVRSRYVAAGKDEVAALGGLAQIRIDGRDVVDLGERGHGDIGLRLRDDRIGALEDGDLDLAFGHGAQNVRRGQQPLAIEEQGKAGVFRVVGRNVEHHRGTGRLEIGQHMIDERELRIARWALLREEIAAFAVKMARDGAQDAERTRGLRDVYASLEAMPGSDGGAWRGRVLAGKRRDGIGRSAANLGRPLRRVRDAKLVVAIDVRRELGKTRVIGVLVDEVAIPEALVDDDMNHGKHHGEVGTGLDLDEGVGMGTKMKMQWVDDDEFGSAFLRVVNLLGWRARMRTPVACPKRS